MVKEIRYTTINRILDECMRHPMMTDLTLEQVISYVLSFIGLNGQPKLYQDKMDSVEIHEFRGLLPCDLISIVQVKDTQTGICLRGMSDNFPAGMSDRKMPRKEKCHTPYIPPLHPHPFEEPSFKTQGRVIYTTFPEGIVEVAYKAIPVDENGFPMLIDDEVYLAALKAYIKQEVFTIKFDMGNLSAQVMQNAQQEYCWKVGQLHSKFTIPSVSEMQSLASAWNTMIPRMREFDNGFRSLNQREYLRKQ